MDISSELTLLVCMKIVSTNNSYSLEVTNKQDALKGIKAIVEVYMDFLTGPDDKDQGRREIFDL